MTTDELRTRLREMGINVPPSDLITRVQLQKFLGCHANTLLKWRQSGVGPQAIRFTASGHWHYSIADVARHLP